MATRKSFTKRVVRRIKRTLSPDEAQNVIEKEFESKKGDKLKFRFDFNPHSPKEPTIEGGFNYGDK